MGILTSLLAPSLRAEGPGPLNDFWYTPTGGAMTASGTRVSEETALAIAAVWNAVTIYGQTVGMLPAITYERDAEGGRHRAPDQDAYRLLHERPNAWQTPFEFKEMLTGHVLLRGNAYAYIQRGPSGALDQLIPLHPGEDRMRVEQLPDRRLIYRYIDARGENITLLQDEVFHLRGMSGNGLTGKGVITVARESLGLTQALERYAESVFGNGTHLSGILKTPGHLDKDTALRMREQWQAAYTGPNSYNKVGVFEDGLEWQAISMTNEDAEFVASRDRQVVEIARWFNLPPHMLKELSRSTNNNIEHQGLEFVIYSAMPWLTRWEQSAKRSLILPQDQDTHYVEFLVDALLRGDNASRAQYYSMAIQWGWMTQNEVRQRENLNPVDGMDVPLQPLNMVRLGQEQAETPAASLVRHVVRDTDGRILRVVEERQPPAAAAPAADTQAVQIVHEAAARLVRKEVARLSALARKHAAEPEAWADAVRAFYVVFVDEVAACLRLPAAEAAAWCSRTQAMVLVGGLAALETWEPDAAHRLADLALGGRHAE